MNKVTSIGSFMRKNATRVAGAAASTAAALSAHSVLAQTGFQQRLQGSLQETGTGIYGTAPTKTLPQIVGGIIQGVLGLLGIVLVVLIIYAGYLWMTAQGDDAKVGKAKKMLSNAIVGMVLIFAAYAITQFVVTTVITGTSQ